VTNSELEQSLKTASRAQTRLLVARKVVPVMMDDHIYAGLFGGGGLGQAAQTILKLTILALGAFELVLEPLLRLRVRNASVSV